MFCKYCGKEIDDGAKFCRHCGKVLDEKSIANDEKKTIDQEKSATNKRLYAIIGGLALVVVALLIAGGGYILSQQQSEHDRQLAEAQAQAEKAAEDAENAKEQVEKAQADAEQAQADAKNAQQAQATAENQLSAVIAAINAAQRGRTIEFDGYIFPSDTVYITEADMAGWNSTVALLARNEIYARHGYVFQTDYIQDYFMAQSWYYPNPNYKGGNFNAIEQANINTILAYEKKRGWQ